MEIEALTRRSIATVQDPTMYQRARERAGPVGINHIGITSTNAQRTHLVEERVAQQKGKAKMLELQRL